MTRAITCNFTRDGTPGSAVFTRGAGIVVTLGDREAGRVAADELDEILADADPPEAIAARLVDYVNMFLGEGIDRSDVAAMRATLAAWVAQGGG